MKPGFPDLLAGAAVTVGTFDGVHLWQSLDEKPPHTNSSSYMAVAEGSGGKAGRVGSDVAYRREIATAEDRDVAAWTNGIDEFIGERREIEVH